MSYSAFNGIEYLDSETGTWKCLVASTPDELRKLHYGFGVRGEDVPYVDVSDFDSGARNFSPEINKEIHEPYVEVTHYDKRPDTDEDKQRYFTILGKDATEESWKKSLETYVPNPNGGFDVTNIYPVCNTIVGVVNYGKLLDIRDRILKEIKERNHYYKTPKEALQEILETIDGKASSEVEKYLKEFFNNKNYEELKKSGYLSDEEAEDNYSELEYYLFAVQSALALVMHYVDEHNIKDHVKYISESDCRLVMWGC